MTIAEKAVALLKEKNLVLSTAESCTGGLIAKMITDVSGASSVFECGIVSYSNNIKEKVLGVKKETLDKYTAVSEQTVREMTIGARKVSGSDVSVAVSGIAGPLSDDSGLPVGLIFIAVNISGEITTKKLLNNFSDNVRENNRLDAAEKTLELLVEMLTKN